MITSVDVYDVYDPEEMGYRCKVVHISTMAASKFVDADYDRNDPEEFFQTATEFLNSLGFNTDKATLGSYTED